MEGGIISLSSFQRYCYEVIVTNTVFPHVGIMYPFPVDVGLGYVACSGHLNMNRCDMCHF